jgi:asparagine synthetase B (glutamine-hydrolysing)
MSSIDLNGWNLISHLILQDLNIGIALWLAARGSGWVYEGYNNNYEDDLERNERVIYKSKARIVLVGSGADEQCAGYGRHKTKYRQGRYGFSLINR